jgi:uncharacterized protein YbjT (DUF2867 family)
VCRSIERSQGLGADEVVIVDALRTRSLGRIADGVDAVFSCLGQTVSADLFIRRPGYLEVDLPGNLNLLRAATGAGVGRFVYVSVFGAERFPGVAYLDAHAQVAQAVKASGLSYAILEPTGFFSAFKEILNMARSNRALLFGDGRARSNPIHEGDLAEVCVDAIEAGESMVVQAGGPAVHTRREIIELAFRALGKPPKITTLPLWFPGAVGRSAMWLAPRIGELMCFLQVLSGHDFAAPVRGTLQLADYFVEHARQ